MSDTLPVGKSGRNPGRDLSSLGIQDERKFKNNENKMVSCKMKSDIKDKQENL